MEKTSYFYTKAEIKEMKELIRTGKPLMQIARDEHKRFDSTVLSFYNKLHKVKKTTTKIKKWDGPKRVKVDGDGRVVVKQRKAVAIPEGTTFEGTAKKVEIHTNHFRVYF